MWFFWSESRFYIKQGRFAFSQVPNWFDPTKRIPVYPPTTSLLEPSGTSGTLPGCQQQAKKAKTAGVLRGRFAEASRKLRGRVAPCLQASGHVAWVAQWSPSLHKLRRNTTSLKMTFVSAPMLAEAKLVNYAPRKVCGSKQ